LMYKLPTRNSSRAMRKATGYGWGSKTNPRVRAPIGGRRRKPWCGNSADLGCRTGSSSRAMAIRRHQPGCGRMALQLRPSGTPHATPSSKPTPISTATAVAPTPNARLGQMRDLRPRSNMPKRMATTSCSGSLRLAAVLAAMRYDVPQSGASNPRPG